MRIELKLFAAAREAIGRETVPMDLPSAASIADLRQVAAERFPELAPLLRHSMYAVDAVYATDATILSEGAEVACIPPVSGG